MIYNVITYMSRMEGNETVMSLAVSHSDSLRTTVPIHIIRKLGLGKGDHVEWDIDKTSDGKWIAVIKKKED